jgi:beta-phosphoglucomutase
MENPKRRVTTVRGIAFDLEGTLVDIEALHHAAHIRAAAEAGVILALKDAIKFLPHFVGGPDEEVAAEIASLTKSALTADKILLAKRMHFNNLLENHNIVPRNGVGSFISWVKNLGIRISIGTTSSRTLAFYLLRQTGLLDEFNQDFIVTKDDVSRSKPSPDMYQETSQRMGVFPVNQLVFEDSVTGINSARSAGSRVVVVPTIQEPYFIKILQHAGAEDVFSSWNDSRLKIFVLKFIGA